jgi:hypothetical protein
MLVNGSECVVRITSESDVGSESVVFFDGFSVVVGVLSDIVVAPSTIVLRIRYAVKNIIA